MTAFEGAIAWLLMAYGIVRLGTDGMRAVRRYLDHRENVRALKQARERAAAMIAQARSR